jgi:hypothetical protein
MWHSLNQVQLWLIYIFLQQLCLLIFVSFEKVVISVLAFVTWWDTSDYSDLEQFLGLLKTFTFFKISNCPVLLPFQDVKMALILCFSVAK